MKKKLKFEQYVSIIYSMGMILFAPYSAVSPHENINRTVKYGALFFIPFHVLEWFLNENYWNLITPIPVVFLCAICSVKNKT